MSADSRPSARDSGDVTRAIDRAVPALLAKQRGDGSWNAFEDMEPSAVASQLVLDAFLERLTAREASEAARFIRTKQLADGSFPGWPHGTQGSVPVTALCIAALTASTRVVSGAAGGAETLTRARAWLDNHGGLHTVVRRFFTDSDQTAVYLAMVGLVDPNELPDPVLAFSLVPPLVRFMELKLNGGVIMGFMAIGFITRYLRLKKQRLPIDPLWAVHRLEAYACEQYIRVFQNPDGNWDGNTIQSGLYVAGLHAAGMSPRSEAMRRGVAWLDKQKVFDEQGMHMCVFTCENWMTSFALRALLHAGVARTDPQIERALRFLAEAQTTIDMPRVDQRKAGAARSGGWAFQPSNPTMPDSDDTGCVLSALGLALQRDGANRLSDATTNLVQRAVDRGLPQLLDMQSDKGGWSAFVWGLGEKAPGPMYTKPMALPSSALEQARFFLAPPVELQDPPVEGITGRVLQGLGAVGYRAGAPAVEDAAKWLETMRAANGAWWGRWLVNYCAGTASVLSGLAACHVDMTQPWITGAVEWLLSKQNADGGWGETPASYSDIAKAGIGTSQPPLTAIVMVALLDARRLADAATTHAIERAAAYLVATQQSDGLWPNNGWLQVMIPPEQFYEYDGERMCRPLEALARYRKALAERAHPPAPADRLRPLTPPSAFPFDATRITGTWDAAKLEALRAFADPIADRVITAVFKAGDAKALGDVMRLLIKSDDPLPAGLPKEAVAYFADTEKLPAWADTKQIAIAQRIFRDHGWAVALGLFTSSLPQAYCAAKGARVLLQTQGMSRNARRRILETAQFVFDVHEKDGFGAQGRAVRAIQKVRLMHATIRHLILIGDEWDHEAWGVPVNQEDLAGTLMTFSVVILDVLATVGIVLSAEEQSAYMHMWTVVGHFLGVDPALWPRDVADGRALMEAIRADQWQASVEGKELGKALVDAMDDYLPLDAIKDLPDALVRRIAGDRCADLLGLAPSSWTKLLLEGASDIDRFLEPFLKKDAQGEELMRRLTTHMMEVLIDVQREGKQASFRIPTELIRAWKLDD